MLIIYTSWLSLKPCRSDTLYLKTIDWKINTFELHCWAGALYPSGKLSLLMANALKKHKSPKARLVLHCSCIVAANINQSFWTCEVAHCPWSSVTESRPTLARFGWLLLLVSFLKQLYSPLNCSNKRDMHNRTSSSVRHWILGPWFCKHRCPCSSAPLRWLQNAPWKCPLPPCSHISFPTFAVSEKPQHWTCLSDCLPSLLPFPSMHPSYAIFIRGSLWQDLSLPTGAREEYLQLQRAQECPSPPCSSPVAEHRALGALPGYWLSPAAPDRERRQNPLLTSLFFCWDQWTQRHWRSFSFNPDGPYEACSASGYHTASWLPQESQEHPSVLLAQIWALGTKYFSLPASWHIYYAAFRGPTHRT